MQVKYKWWLTQTFPCVWSSQQTVHQPPYHTESPIDNHSQEGMYTGSKSIKQTVLENLLVPWHCFCMSSQYDLHCPEFLPLGQQTKQHSLYCHPAQSLRDIQDGGYVRICKTQKWCINRNKLFLVKIIGKAKKHILIWVLQCVVTYLCLCNSAILIFTYWVKE